MAAARNVLFIMCDQLRYDYLSCYGHPHLKTPNIDRLAARGLRFERAYTQATICGPARMCAYTGRYMRSHGSTANGVPLRVGEPTLGDHLKEIGVRNVLVGKTHMTPDREGMQRLGLDPQSVIGVHVAQCGFEPFERDDGLHPDGPYDPDPPYDAYLRAQGFEAENPWEHWANSGEAGDGSLQNGWLLIHADKPARVPEEHSETPYMTRRAMAFMREAEADGRPWCCHLSYIKPHWPYIVPAPYHNMYGPEHVVPAIRSEEERRDPHPVYKAFMAERYSRSFAREEVRRRVLPAYMGLIKQIDDQLGLLFRFLSDEGLMETTLIVFTSDHGDYLGDHWLGEKQLFHDVSSRVPLIVHDPDRSADATRGMTSHALVELIDLAPTFLDYFGGTPKPHVLEGRSLLPLLRGGAPSAWRRAAISEYDFTFNRARVATGTSVTDARLTMVMDGRWKYVHAPGMRPMLHDLKSDPQELVDLGASAPHSGECARLEREYHLWMSRLQSRITVRHDRVLAADAMRMEADLALSAGVMIGYWDEAEIEAARQKLDAAKARQKG